MRLRFLLRHHATFPLRPRGLLLPWAIPILFQPQASLSRVGCGDAAPQSRSFTQRAILDEDIGVTNVGFIDEAGQFQGTRDLRELLAKLPRETHHILQVSAKGEDGYPVCRLISKPDLEVWRAGRRTREKEIKDKKKKNKIVVKTIEMGWAIGPNDLEHRLKKCKDFLTKGYRLNIMIGVKKGMQKLPLEDMQLLVEDVVEELGRWGAERLPREGQVGRRYEMFWEGKKADGTGEAEDEMEGGGGYASKESGEYGVEENKEYEPREGMKYRSEKDQEGHQRTYV